MSARQGMCPGEWETMEKFLSNKGSPGEWETIEKFLSPPRDQRVGSCRCSSPHFGVGMSQDKGCVRESGKLSESSSPTKGVRESGKLSKSSSPPLVMGVSVRQEVCPGEWETIKKFLSPLRDQRVGS